MAERTEQISGGIGVNILYLPPIPYNGLMQRPQFLAQELAREHKVLYLNPTVSAMKFFLKGGERPKGFIHKISEGLTEERLNGWWSAHRCLEGLWSGFGFPERAQLKKHLAWADTVWIGYAPWFDLVRDFSGTVIYDKMDDDIQITQNKLLRKLIARIEPQLTARADHIFTTARCFYEQFAAQGKTPVLVPNAVDKKSALALQRPLFQKKPGMRVFGYVGMISHWFDVEAIRTILDAAPCNQVVLVGPIEIALPEHERLICVGRVPKKDINGWTASFDVCVYPFQKTPFLDTINPVKIYEYLAANKPVLAVNSREILSFNAKVTTYENHQELLAKLRALSFCPPFLTENERMKFIRDNSWKERGARVLAALRQEP